MDMTIYGLSAFSYVWNQEKDNQSSSITAFAKAVIAIPCGIKINECDAESIILNHPTSIFARSICKASNLPNRLNISKDHQQQPTPPVLQDHELPTMVTNTCKSFAASINSSQSTTMTHVSETPDQEESGENFLTKPDIREMGDKITQEEIPTEQNSVTQPAIAISKFDQHINEDDFSFLDNFPCAETTQEQKTSRQTFLDNWFTAYSDTFVAHASRPVAEVYESMLVENKKLLCGEALCRKGFINFETGRPHKRNNLKFDMEKIKELILTEEIPLYDISIKPSDDEELLFQWSYVKDGIELSCKERFDYTERVDDFAKQHEIPNYLCYLALDEMRDEECRVHPIIHTLYAELKKQAESNPEVIDSTYLKKTIDSLISIRKIILNYPSTSELRFSPQVVYWEYGDLVILKGDLPKSVVTGKGLLIGEVFGLQSMENHGSFYHLDLHEDDVLILAPRSINGHSLEGLRSTMGYHNMYFYDELADKYLDQLNVPKDLREKNEPSISEKTKKEEIT